MQTAPASRMSSTARALTLVAALLLGALYFTPLWSVRLVAPQYPEGLGMYIRLHTVDGVKEHDLRNINSLNKYIGMKAIQPDAIPELRYMPWIVGGLLASGLLVAALGRRRLLLGWVIAFAALGVAGMYDFWRWEHDYGHNLDLENAVIVVPGMNYQPPLIGTKQLLNFTASSYPAAGAVAAAVAMLLGAAALFMSYRGGRRLSPATVALAAAAACSAATPTIALGTDTCVECRMLISDARFGGVVVTRTGKTLKFDSVDCLVGALARMADGNVRSVWVAPARGTGLIRAEDATFTREATLRPPMGTTLALAGAADSIGIASPGSRLLSWAELTSGAPAGAAHAR